VSAGVDPTPPPLPTSKDTTTSSSADIPRATPGDIPTAATRPDRGPRPRPAPRVSAGPARCSPPFVYDSAGHKVYKEECF
jgi:hypothetical protein